jgi:hypothetical protein
MKKVLLLLVTFVSVIYVSAQEVNSSQSQSAPISIDSLSIKLNEIQHNYDFMYCDYELHKLIMDLKDLAHSIDNSSNGVLINVYNSRYDRRLYNAYVANYDSDCNLFDSLKEKTDTVKATVFVRIMTSEFTEKELNVLTASLDVVSKATMKVESSLNYYNVAIQAYRDKI